MAKDDDIWFEQKSFGYGAGLPIAWQGWVLIGAYLGALAGITLALMPAHPWAYYGLLAALTVAMMVVAARHTRGGWRWRWGD